MTLTINVREKSIVAVVQLLNVSRRTLERALRE